MPSDSENLENFVKKRKWSPTTKNSSVSASDNPTTEELDLRQEIDKIKEVNSQLLVELKATKDELVKQSTELAALKQKEPQIDVLLKDKKKKVQEEDDKKAEEQDQLKQNVWNIPFAPLSNGAKLVTLLAVGGFTTYHIFFKKSKESKNLSLQKEIEKKFQEWKNNIYLSVFFYVVFFFLARDGINFFIKPYIKEYLAKSEFFTFLFLATIMGLLFILDSVITSKLKTPLSRLGVKIETAPIEEKEKKLLLSKTQEASEGVKETLKKFGIMVIPTILIGLVGKELWEKKLVSNFSFAIPIFYSLWRIWESESKIKGIKEKVK